MQWQAINKSTLENEYDIGIAVTEWTRCYNKKQGKAITNILHEVPIDVFTWLLTEPMIMYIILDLNYFRGIFLLNLDSYINKLPSYVNKN